MMKKVLLLGDLNKVMGNLNKYLSTEMQTQMCPDKLDILTAMLDIYTPNLFLIFLHGREIMEKRIVDYLCENCPNIPILLLGKSEECKFYQEKYDAENVHYVVRPTTLGALLQRCEILLNGSEDEELQDDMSQESTEENEDVPRKCILAADDNGVFLRSLKGMLEKHYDVIVATSGEMALSQAKKKMPNLILLDYEMPGWDGKKTFEEIRKEESLKDIPVVFLTAVSDKKHIQDVLELKPAGYLLKPINQQRIFRTIEEALIEI